MNATRRNFIRNLACSAGAAFLMGKTAHAAKSEAAPMKISTQEGLLPGATVAERLDSLEKYGFDAMELSGGGLPGRVKEIQEALKGRDVKISAVCAGYGGCLISPDAAERNTAVEDMKKILAACGELGSTGLIFVPAFKSQYNVPDLSPYKSKYDLSRALLVEQLKPLGEYALSCGTRLLMEPLNRYEAQFLNRVADAVAICGEVGSKGVCVMADFFHMNIEEADKAAAIHAGGALLHHIHLADNTRKLPGQGEMNYVPGFRALQQIGYPDYCSLECGILGDAKEELPKCVKFLREQWSLAAKA
ncbi:MAG TPA: sugar phosphate isomerase/epimerase family protein [bacterium]|nr:sugar phosphate isomerase/epimerase family protein [bacterium]HQO36352.1 sugar phosphate isomerase/epimerase family protein [bacterium]HQQ01252.1 sugar phosphate isomerase/epimerase family protein [bacterium]